MRLKPYLPYLVVLLLLGGAALALLFGTGVDQSEGPGVAAVLPDRIGLWTGDDLYYCQNESCLQTALSSDLSAVRLCPQCGQPMVLAWSLAEKRLLPPDTVLIKKYYRASAGSGLLVSIVVNGSEQVSIHRPQICLTGQGFEIASEHTLAVPLERRPDLKLRVLDLFQRNRTAEGWLNEQASFYAYWFVSERHETPSHGERTLLTVWDRVIRGRAIRWAYVSVSGLRTANPAAYEQQLRDFIRRLYPQVIRRGGTS